MRAIKTKVLRGISLVTRTGKAQRFRRGAMNAARSISRMVRVK